MPFGHPSYSAASVHSSAGVILKMRPYGMSVTNRLPARSNAGPSRKLSISLPGLFASHHSVRRLRRKESGRRVSTRASITCGAVKERFHMAAILTGLLGLHARAAREPAPAHRLLAHDLPARLGRHAAGLRPLLRAPVAQPGTPQRFPRPRGALRDLSLPGP